MPKALFSRLLVTRGEKDKEDGRICGRGAVQRATVTREEARKDRTSRDESEILSTARSARKMSEEAKLMTVGRALVGVAGMKEISNYISSRAHIHTDTRIIMQYNLAMV